MDTMTNDTMRAKLADAILGYVARSEDGAESVSYVHRSLSQDGWRGLGVLADFEQRCRQLGFTVRRGTNRRGQSRIEVAL